MQTVGLVYFRDSGVFASTSRQQQKAFGGWSRIALTNVSVRFRRHRFWPNTGENSREPHCAVRFLTDVFWFLLDFPLNCTYVNWLFYRSEYSLKAIPAVSNTFRIRRSHYLARLCISISSETTFTHLKRHIAMIFLKWTAKSQYCVHSHTSSNLVGISWIQSTLKNLTTWRNAHRSKRRFWPWNFLKELPLIFLEHQK